MELTYERVTLGESDRIAFLSSFASSITREYYDPIIGKKQNDYHLAKFQSVRGISEQLKSGYTYYLVYEENTPVGFLAYYPRGDALYLSKYYVSKESRGKGIGRKMLGFLIDRGKELGLVAIELNVNRFNPTTAIYEHMGFLKIREEQIDVGQGFIMDDFVYRLEF